MEKVQHGLTRTMGETTMVCTQSCTITYLLIICTGKKLIPGLHPLCHVTADLTNVLVQKRSINGRLFWELDFEVAILFGGTKLQAQLQWSKDVSFYTLIQLLFFNHYLQDEKYSGPITVFHKSTIV